MRLHILMTHNNDRPMPSPIMAGGLFSIDRARFWELGGYDPEMALYGGEEMEISLRLWMCGSTLECIPCSRVGHIFRTDAYYKGRVYPVPGHVIIRNKLRAAKMWLPSHYSLVEQASDRLPPGKTIGDLSWATEIQERLQCKDFDWYLDNVYPELFVPDDRRSVLQRGALANVANNVCMDTLGKKSQGDQIGLYSCHDGDAVGVGTQDFVLTTKREIRVPLNNFDMCIDRGFADPAGGTLLSLYGCHGGGGNQHWKYDAETGFLSDHSSCLEAKESEGGGDERPTTTHTHTHTLFLFVYLFVCFTFPF